MANLVSRVLSIVVVAGYFVVALATGGLVPSVTVVLLSLLPLACIWFPEVMGSLAYIKGMPMNETPEGFVVAGGWLVLLLPIYAPFFLRLLQST